MSRKTFVIDTNVLLHDPQALKKFKDNDVIIPLIVLEELDAMKRQFDERGFNAREVLRFIDSLRPKENEDFHKGIALPEGPRLRLILDNERPKNFPLPLDRNSNKILLIAALLKERGERVVFVSKDFVSRVKAETLQIEAEDYENLKVSYDHLVKGISKIEVPKMQIDTFYKDGYLPPLKEHFANEYCLLTSPEHSSCICRFNAKEKRLEGLLKREKKVWGIEPLNLEQKCALDLLFRDDISLVALVGPAGTGKTLLALASGMMKVFDEGLYSRILVSRPIVPLGKDIGYLPGTKEEKLLSWMQPIYDNLEYLCLNHTAEENVHSYIEWIRQSKKLEMEAVTFIRGRSLPNIYFIIDEAQNLTPHEMKAIISRAGKGTKVILNGDPTQIDNPYLDKDSNGLSYAISKFKGHPLFGYVFLERTERSELASLAAEIML